MSEANYTPNRIIKIGEKSIYVFDALFTEQQIKEFHHCLLISNYSCLQASKAETTDYKEWVAGFDIEDFKSHWLYKVCSEILVSLNEAQGTEYVCANVFGNLFSFGSFTFTHTDSSDLSNASKDISFLYYANSEWNYEWGGETIFYDQDMDPLSCVGMKPGRLICFTGDIPHRSGIPTRYCNEHRLTFSVRFMPSKKFS